MINGEEMADSKQIQYKYDYMPFSTGVVDAYKNLPSTAKMFVNSLVEKENITDKNVSKYFTGEELNIIADLAEKQQSLIDEGKINARLGAEGDRKGQILNQGISGRLLDYTERKTNALLRPETAPLLPPGKDIKDLTPSELDEVKQKVASRREAEEKRESERIPYLSPILDLLNAPSKFNVANTLGKFRYSLPNLAGQRGITDRYDWHLGKDKIREAVQMLGGKSERKSPEGIRWLLETAASTLAGDKAPEINFNAPPPYKGGGWNFDSRTGEYLYSDDQRQSSQNIGTSDPGQGGDFSTTEDEGYTSLDIGYRGGGQISQGLDNLYMKKRNEPKEKLYDMMGYKERQYGGGLDDAYMTLSQRRDSAFADPNANSAFASPMSMGGLPTIYRYYGGTLGEFSGIEENMGGPTSEEAAGGTMSDPNDWTDPANWANTGLDDPAIVTTPSAPTSDDEIDITGFPTDPNVGVFGRTLQTPAQIKSRLSGDKPEDGYTRVESTYLNDILAKNPGMTINQAENYLASVMATPGGIAAMERGFFGNYTGGGPAGTLDNFIRGVGADLGLQEIAAREKRRKADPYDDFGVKERDDSFIGSIKDTVSRFFQGNRGITTEEGKEEFKEALADKGATFIPYQESPLSSAISLGNTLLNPVSGISSIFEFITGATPLGTIVTKEGIRLGLDANYNVIPEQSIREYDEGNITTPVTRQKPLEKKKSTKKEEKKKDTTKKTDNTEKIKASNIDRLKSYMSLTGKDLSTSKKDLAITDISITEEDFT
jgi:hypothetical protein